MQIAAPTLEDLTLEVTVEKRVRASRDATFAALLEQMGPHNAAPDGSPLPMTLEAYPGGRWFRDLGGDNGHHWGHVQAIKRPGLLEISGPLFMSYPAISNVQIRLTDDGDDTVVTLRHTAMGLIQENHRAGLAQGWTPLLDRVAAAATRAGSPA